MLRFPHFLDNQLTDGGKVVSPMRQPPFTPQEDSWYSFLLEAESDPRAIMRLEGLGQLKKSTSFNKNAVKNCDILLSVADRIFLLKHAMILNK
jgi:hypothetical protein